MCRFFSAVVGKNKIYWDLDIDSHSILIEKFKLNDKTNSPDFVRVEISPKDNDLFNHNLNNWEAKVDQDFKPEWFNLEEVRSALLESLCECFEKRFIKNNCTQSKIDGGRWFVNGNKELTILGNSKVMAFGSCQLKVYGNSKVDVLDSCKVEARDFSSIFSRDICQIYTFDLSKCIALDRSKVEAHDNSKVYGHDRSEIELHDFSKFEANDFCKVTKKEG